MNRILASVIVLAVIGTGGAMAQNAPTTAVDPLPEAGDFFTSTDARDFYADEAMSTTRSDEEMKASFDRMSPEQQERMRAACAADTAGKYSAMCKVAM